MIPIIFAFIPFLLATTVVLLAPVLSSKHIFFGVKVEPGFRGTETARRLLRQYRLAIAAAALAGLLVLAAWPSALAAMEGSVLLLIVVMALMWRRSYRVAVKYQRPPLTEASVELSTEPDRLPGFFWVCAIPPLILAGTALYLQAHWAQIPARYPIHWGPTGQPNGWATRSLRGVYGPLMLAGLCMIWLIGMAFAAWHGARRSSLRVAVAKIMLAVEFLFGLIAPLVALLPIYQPKPALMVALISGGVAGVIAYSIAAFRQTASDAGDEVAAANSGSSCFDRRNPALLLPRPDGLGYIPNLAHPLAWVLLVYPFVVVLFAIAFLF